MRNRFQKQRLLALLKREDFNVRLPEIRDLAPRRAIGPLTALLCDADEMVKWRSVMAIGALAAELAETDRESARVIMRRLMWHLNDESGGIGWGVPEAMGEIMARSPALAEEYDCILVSYLQPEGNYIEHPMLQRGVLWGFGRLAHARPGRVTGAAGLLPPYLMSDDAVIRGLAADAAGALPAASTEPFLRQLADDRATFRMFRDGRLVDCCVGRLAKAALKNFHQL